MGNIFPKTAKFTKIEHYSTAQKKWNVIFGEKIFFSKNGGKNYVSLQRCSRIYYVVQILRAPYHTRQGYMYIIRILSRKIHFEIPIFLPIKHGISGRKIHSMLHFAASFCVLLNFPLLGVHVQNSKRRQFQKNFFLNSVSYLI